MTPIQFVHVGHSERAFRAAGLLISQGFFVNAAGYPAVAMNGGGVRLTLSNHLRFEDIDRVTAAIRDVTATQH